MKEILKRIGQIALLLLLLLVAWGLVEPYLLDEEQVEVALPQLPAAWDGATIAVLADFQVGMWLDNLSTIEEAVGRIVEAQPAAVLLAGDFVYKAAGPQGEEIAKVVALLTPLRDAGIPVYAVLGNHDYSLGGRREPDPTELALAGRVEEALEGLGIAVLHNEAVAVAGPGGAPLYIAGIGSHYAMKDRPQEAPAQVPADAGRIVMMHNPDSYPALPAATAPLAVAGHLHGGQITVPYTPHWSMLALFQPGDVHADGWAENSYGAPGNRLYVNRGLGMSVVPLRIFARPELTFFTLSAAP